MASTGVTYRPGMINLEVVHLYRVSADGKPDQYPVCGAGKNGHWWTTRGHLLDDESTPISCKNCKRQQKKLEVSNG